MFKDNRYINAGTNEIYRYGHKAVERVEAHLDPNEAGYISIPVNGGKFWTIGTSKGKFGEFCKLGETIFSVNSYGNAYAKAGTEKGEKLVAALRAMIEEMHRLNAERIAYVREVRGYEDEDDE